LSKHEHLITFSQHFEPGHSQTELRH